MKAQSRTERMQVASRAEVAPHIRRATSFYQRHQRPRPVVERPAQTLAEHNPLIPLLRAISLTRGHKQPGRRYGPAPKFPPKVSAQSPAPMGNRRRVEVYNADGTTLTQRQARQFDRMYARSLWREEASRA